jgi:hypothetical protein
MAPTELAAWSTQAATDADHRIAPRCDSIDYPNGMTGSTPSIR